MTFKDHLKDVANKIINAMDKQTHKIPNCSNSLCKVSAGACFSAFLIKYFNAVFMLAK